jgi:multicomponent Na+:H+ antiporter subunit D
VVTTFLAATATKVSVYVLIRFYFLVFGHAFALDGLPLRSLLVGLSAVAIVAMSLVALFQPDLKRMLAYSSVAQIGYITLGLGLANAAGLTGSLAHLVNHGVTKGALFLLAGGIAFCCGSTSIADLRGLSRRMPWTAFAFVVAGLSLIGVPGTAGFTSKWFLVEGALENGQTWIVALIVASSLLAVAYVWRVVEAMYLALPDAPAPAPAPMAASVLMRGSTAVGVALTVVLGFVTTYNVGYARRAVALLLEGVS